MWKYSLCLVLLVCSSWTLAPENSTKSKTFAATYPREAVPMLVLENQLGNVKVITHARSEVRVEAVMKVTKRTEAAAVRTLALLAVEETTTSDMLALVTVLGGKLENQPGESVSINYTLWVPADLPMDLSNSLGDLEVGNLSGPGLRLALEYGTLKVGNLRGPDTQVEASFVNGGSIGQVAQGDLALKYCQNFTIGQLGEVLLELEGTSLVVEEAESLTLDHEYGGLTLGKVGVLQGDVSYGRLQVKEVTQEIALSGSHVPSLTVEAVAASTHSIFLDLAYSKAALTLAASAKGSLTVTRQGGSFRWEGSRLQVSETTENGKAKAQGTYGGGGSGRIKVTTEFGSLSLRQ